MNTAHQIDVVPLPPTGRRKVLATFAGTPRGSWSLRPLWLVPTADGRTVALPWYSPLCCGFAVGEAYDVETDGRQVFRAS